MSAIPCHFAPLQLCHFFKEVSSDMRDELLLTSLDASVVERVLDLASIVFNESGDNFDDCHSSYNINIFSFYFSFIIKYFC